MKILIGLNREIIMREMVNIKLECKTMNVRNIGLDLVAWDHIAHFSEEISQALCLRMKYL